MATLIAGFTIKEILYHSKKVLAFAVFEALRTGSVPCVAVIGLRAFYQICGLPRAGRMQEKLKEFLRLFLPAFYDQSCPVSAEVAVRNYMG